jgi:magnesium-transporting ATPase (P-type)
MNPQFHSLPMTKRQGRSGSTLLNQLLLWLWVINLGIALGAGLYEATIVFPQWLLAVPEGGYHWQADAARAANTGLRFWVYVTTVPLTVLTIAHALVAWPLRGKLRRWWLGAVGLALVERLFTFGYFVPTMLHLMGDNVTGSDAIATALRWSQLNHLRHMLLLLAWVAALQTFALFYQHLPSRRTG